MAPLRPSTSSWASAQEVVATASQSAATEGVVLGLARAALGRGERLQSVLEVAGDDPLVVNAGGIRRGQPNYRRSHDRRVEQVGA
jgi:hypothetical protein